MLKWASITVINPLDNQRVHAPSTVPPEETPINPPLPPYEEPPAPPPTIIFPPPPPLPPFRLPPPRPIPSNIPPLPTPPRTQSNTSTLPTVYVNPLRRTRFSPAIPALSLPPHIAHNYRPTFHRPFHHYYAHNPILPQHYLLASHVNPLRRTRFSPAIPTAPLPPHIAPPPPQLPSNIPPLPTSPHSSRSSRLVNTSYTQPSRTRSSATSSTPRLPISSSRPSVLSSTQRNTRKRASDFFNNSTSNNGPSNASSNILSASTSTENDNTYLFQFITDPLSVDVTTM